MSGDKTKNPAAEKKAETDTKTQAVASTPAPDAGANNVKPSLEAQTVTTQQVRDALDGEDPEEDRFERRERERVLTVASMVADVVIKQLIANGVLKQAPGQRDPNQPLKKKQVDPRWAGTHHFIIGPQGAYRNNRIMKRGEVVTVTNERPARDWTECDANGVPLDPEVAEKMAREAAAKAESKIKPDFVGDRSGRGAIKRASDLDVG